MKSSSLHLWPCAAIILVCSVFTTFAQKAKMSVEESVLVTMTGTVKDIDLEKRELTLKGSLGDEVTFTVDKAVKRLDEVKVGDEINADYYISVAAELREPTEDEKKEPIQYLETVAKSPEGTAPAAGGLRMLRVVATVEGLERPTRRLTLKGPRGKYLTVRARDVARLEKLRLGDTIVVTLTEALAVSLEKVKKRKDA